MGLAITLLGVLQRTRGMIKAVVDGVLLLLLLMKVLVLLPCIAADPADIGNAGGLLLLPSCRLVQLQMCVLMALRAEVV